MWKFWIDTGGTFTDCLAERPDGHLERAKVLSSSCVRGRASVVLGEDEVVVRLSTLFPNGFFTGYELRLYSDGEPWCSEIVEWDGEKSHARLDRSVPFSEESVLCEIASPEEPPAFVARVVTKTPLQQTLPLLEMKLATTRGTNALLEEKGAKVALITNEGFSDLLRIGNQQRPDLFELGITKQEPLFAETFEVSGRLDAEGSELVPLDEEHFRDWVRRVMRAGEIASFAIALLHSYRNPQHEESLARILAEEGATYVSVSSRLSPFAKVLHRTETTVVNAYLSPIMDTYLNSVQRSLGGRSLRVMTSAGGLVTREQYHPKDSLLSGPAGGVVGSSSAGLQTGCQRTIAFDMGGTSTDVSRFDGGFDYRYEKRIGGARVFAPTLHIETVAAGGGSICSFDGSALKVGPESAGAFPGPACYGAGGPLTITDVNLLLGRLDAEQFGVPIERKAAERCLETLKTEISDRTGKSVGSVELLKGFVEIANERMAEAIRKISLGEGYDPAEYALVAFGGAGGLHACAVAAKLDIARVLFPADAGILSAKGLRVARLEQEAAQQVLQKWTDVCDRVPEIVATLKRRATDALKGDGVSLEEIEILDTRFELRFAGQESTLHVDTVEVEFVEALFKSQYSDQFGFSPQDLEVELVSVRQRAVQKQVHDEEEHFKQSAHFEPATGLLKYWNRNSLALGSVIIGPAIVQDDHSTVFVEEGWRATVGSRLTLRIDKTATDSPAVFAKTSSEVVELELFTNKFLSLVDEMGVLLERVAFSTNVKERRDFSCALLDSQGCLVANAPHIPVHLGALGVCVRAIRSVVTLEPGDVVVTNHPAFGGSHLPDVTLVSPVYGDDGLTLLGYVACRAHHAEIGGISPGSMPPNARNLEEEGVVVPPIKLMENGRIHWERVEKLLTESRFPTRSLSENKADLSAQLASLKLGGERLAALAK